MSNHANKSASSQELERKKVPESTLRKEPSGLVSLRESQLVAFGERITYVFSLGKEVGSIHFDKGRGEIFFKGHNIRNMDLEEWQMQMLEKMRSILVSHEKGRGFAESYARILDKIIVEKKSSRKL